MYLIKKKEKNTQKAVLRGKSKDNNNEIMF